MPDRDIPDPNLRYDLIESNDPIPKKLRAEVRSCDTRPKLRTDIEDAIDM
jgi:hypothetical protein